jgi:hypothetical protein
VAYCGTAAGVFDHFKSLGHTCPQYHNPAEFLIDLVAIDTDEGPEVGRCRLTVSELVLKAPTV